MSFTLAHLALLGGGLGSAKIGWSGIMGFAFGSLRVVCGKGNLVLIDLLLNGTLIG
jgi:hypothetical protein